jgi:hypothetical protein
MDNQPTAANVKGKYMAEDNSMKALGPWRDFISDAIDDATKWCNEPCVVECGRRRTAYVRREPPAGRIVGDAVAMVRRTPGSSTSVNLSCWA